MAKKHKIIFGGVVLAWFAGLLVYYLHKANFQVLNSKGSVAHDERNLILFTVVLGLFVVLPVFAMTAAISWKYREGNKQARYHPDFDHNTAIESVWWLIPSLIILVLSVITWNTSHSLDPRQPLSAAAPLKIQVVALDWKWLFIYPEQGVASVNYVQIPVGRPVQFEITSNGPMNSFWIPQLGSQIYAMAGMSTHLNLEADTPGDYKGSSANISGRGFAGMTFTARAGSMADFNNWLTRTRGVPAVMDTHEFKVLAKPSENYPEAVYSSTENGLYDRVLASFQLPGARI